MTTSEIVVRVDFAEALSHPTDLLVLKYAQHSYGVDLMAVDALGVEPAALPADGGHLLTAGPAVAARRVLFVGVEPIHTFAYKTVRTFARRALAIAAEQTPEIHEISMTLHGAGFGLDEVEAFEAEIAGIIDAISAGTYPSDLTTVTVLEFNKQRAQRMRDTLGRIVPNGRIEAARPYGRDSVVPASVERLRAVGYDSETKGHSFVAMPFDPEFDDVLYFGIAPPIRTAGLLCERMDGIAFVGDIVLQMKDRISTAAFVVADLTGANPNVYLEIGYAWGCGVPTILLCRDGTEPTFDARGHRYLSYASIRELHTKLSSEIPFILRSRGSD